jgi:hypothetical protein
MRVARHVHNERFSEPECPREGLGSQRFSESPPVFRIPRCRMVATVTFSMPSGISQTSPLAEAGADFIRD